MSWIRIALTRQKSALIDETDFNLVISFNKRWSCTCSHGVWYAQACKNYTTVHMHRLIMGFPEEEIHHLNGDGLDNRRCNLILCSRSEHSRTKAWPNKSGFRGVCFEAGRRKGWVAHIRIPGEKKQTKIGRFETAEEAAHAYDEAARKFHGEQFLKLNFP